MRCSACQKMLELQPGERVGLRATCPHCGADLHVCLNCRHHDPSAHNQCKEPAAEWVSDHERANHCDYFSPGDTLGKSLLDEQQRARTRLTSLFKKP